ncbi:MAG: polymer-forming cytoskeletal protein [Gemmatimonadota bacterium]|jgi:hypothetical protein|nr:polymer-forming cytoskeletal protein [Gemmatimonadota bacterium]
MFRRREPAPPRDGLVVGPADRVQGTVTAEAVTVEGEFDGTLTVRDRLVVGAGGTVTGSIDGSRLRVEAGATVRATCRIGVDAREFLVLPVATPEPVVDETRPVPRRESRRLREDESSSPGTGLGW